MITLKPSFLLIPCDRGLQNTAFVEKMNWKKIMNKEALLSVCNFKNKPPDGEWSTPYDRALQKYSFCEKNDETSAVCRGISEKFRRKLSSLISY